MSGSGIVLDTNAVIHFVDGHIPADVRLQLEGRSAHISFITEIEVRSYTGGNEAHVAIAMEFLSLCSVHGISQALKDEAVRLRKTYSLKTPDALIAAIAVIGGLPLMTSDKGLRRISSEVPLLYFQPLK